MKHFKLFLMMAFFILAPALYGQSLDIPYHNVSYKLKELKVKDSTFLHCIDTMIFAKKYPTVVNKKMPYFFVLIPQKKEELVHSIWIESNRKPKKSARDLKEIGYFIFKKHFFFVYGSDLYNMFQKTSQIKTFTYEEGGLPYVEDLPIWELRLINKKWTLISFDAW